MINGLKTCLQYFELFLGCLIIFLFFFLDLSEGYSTVKGKEDELKKDNKLTSFSKYFLYFYASLIILFLVLFLIMYLFDVF